MTLKPVKKTSTLKKTASRQRVLDILSDSKKPLRAEDIEKKAKDLNSVTIYRTLASFEKEGIIRKIDLRKDSFYYELSENHHHYIVCESCGDIENIDVCVPQSLAKEVLGQSKKFSMIDDHSLEFFGLCKLCLKK